MNRLHGIDIYSKYQGVYTPADNPPKPVDFVICKFSEGYASVTDLDKVWNGAKQAKSKEGYHYWRNTTLQRQIDAFLVSADGRDVDAAWLDWEPYNNNLTKAQYDLAGQWITAMQAIFPKVGLYTNASCWNQMNGWGDWHKKVPFWYARYIYFPLDPFTYNPPLPLECEGWDTWQYGVCLTYGNPDNGLNYGVQSKTLDVNVRIPQEPQEPPTDCEALKAEIAELKAENEEMRTALMDIREITDKWY